MSNELPWKPCTSTKRCTPRYCLGAQGTKSSASRDAGGEVPDLAAYLCSKSTGRASIFGISERSSKATPAWALTPALRTLSAWRSCSSPISSSLLMTKTSSLMASFTTVISHRLAIWRSQETRSRMTTSRGASSMVSSAQCQASRMRSAMELISKARCLATLSGVTAASALRSQRRRMRAFCPLTAHASVHCVDDWLSSPSLSLGDLFCCRCPAGCWSTSPGRCMATYSAGVKHVCRTNFDHSAILT
mmetsp:Transcript_90208/g.232869  ORF Transcript_90208/g.232869 Transcript_90208/m.232869 type:complete len:247 (+) Transcript_90208:803-1543(+)